MGYRPFGRFRSAGIYPAGDQWPEPPAELKDAVDGPLKTTDFNRFERAVYRWLAHPRLFRRRRKPDS